MDFDTLYHFLFETYGGIGVLILLFFAFTLIVSVVLERKTRKRFKNHEKSEDDWSLFDDEEESSKVQK